MPSYGNYTIVVPDAPEIHDYIAWAWYSGLYMPTRNMQYDYQHALARSPRRRVRWTFNGQRYSRPYTCVAVALDDKQDLVGICFLSWFYVGFYVRPQHRKVGLARELFNHLTQVHDLGHQVLPYQRSDASTFFKKTLPGGGFNSFTELWSFGYQLRKQAKSHVT